MTTTIRLKALTAKQISELLSVREFVLICSHFDAQKVTAPSRMLAGDGDGSPVKIVAGLTREAQFRIFEVNRTPESLRVICVGEDNQLLDLDCSEGRSDCKIMPAPSKDSLPKEERPYGKKLLKERNQ